jgi:hypothetical protein
MNEFLVKLISNGGPGSGNFNPGQGRGKGKPGSGSSSKSSDKTSGKSSAEKARESAKKSYLSEEPSESLRETVRKKIIEIEPGFDYDDYDKLSDYAFDLVDRCDSVKDLKDMLEREYSGFLSESDIDDLIGLSDFLEEAGYWR